MVAGADGVTRPSGGGAPRVLQGAFLHRFDGAGNDERQHHAEQEGEDACAGLACAGLGAVGRSGGRMLAAVDGLSEVGASLGAVGVLVAADEAVGDGAEEGLAVEQGAVAVGAPVEFAEEQFLVDEAVEDGHHRLVVVAAVESGADVLDGEAVGGAPEGVHEARLKGAEHAGRTPEVGLLGLLGLFLCHSGAVLPPLGWAARQRYAGRGRVSSGGARRVEIPAFAGMTVG